MVRSEGNMSLKNPVTPPGIDPGTVRLVAQRLNHSRTPLNITFLHINGDNQSTAQQMIYTQQLHVSATSTQSSSSYKEL